jgi:hypothetical protein
MQIGRTDALFVRKPAFCSAPTSCEAIYMSIGEPMLRIIVFDVLDPTRLQLVIMGKPAAAAGRQWQSIPFFGESATPLHK